MVSGVFVSWTDGAQETIVCILGDLNAAAGSYMYRGVCFTVASVASLRAHISIKGGSPGRGWTFILSQCLFIIFKRYHI